MIVIPGKTSKGSHYHKAYYSYPQVLRKQSVASINPGQILIEINSFANPYPYERLSIADHIKQKAFTIGERLCFLFCAMEQAYLPEGVET